MPVISTDYNRAKGTDYNRAKDLECIIRSENYSFCELGEAKSAPAEERAILFRAQRS